MGSMKDQISLFTVALTTTAAGGVPRDIQLFPAGQFRATDGRPHDVESWVLTRADAEQIIAEFEQRKNPAVIDYEHQTLLAKENGKPAPASGWFKTLQWREPTATAPGGLWAIGVDWTAAAARMIEGKEYQFISPVFIYDDAGHVRRVLHAALTNYPALDGMAAVAAAFNYPTPASTQPQSTQPKSTHHEAPKMDELIERLRYLLNLPVTTTTEELVAQLDKLKAQIIADGQQAAATFDGLGAYITGLKEQADKVAALTQKLAETEGRMAALSASHQPTAVVEELKTQIAALSAEHTKRQIDDLVKPALADGRLLASQESWARDLGKTNLAALTAYLQTAQPIAALTTTQTGGVAPDAEKPKLTPDELTACTLLGQNPDEYLSFKTGAK